MALYGDPAVVAANRAAAAAKREQGICTHGWVPTVASIPGCEWCANMAASLNAAFDASKGVVVSSIAGVDIVQHGQTFEAVGVSSGHASQADAVKAALDALVTVSR